MKIATFIFVSFPVSKKKKKFRGSRNNIFLTVVFDSKSGKRKKKCLILFCSDRARFSADWDKKKKEIEESRNSNLN